MTERTLGPAREVIRLFALSARSLRILDRVGTVEPSSVEQFGIGLLVVPDVGVAVPVLVADLLRPGQLLEVENARLQSPPALRIAALHVQEDGLHHNCPIRDAPAGR